MAGIPTIGPGDMIELPGTLGGKRQFIYLAGNISKDERTYLWRKEFTWLMRDYPVVILNPCDNEFNKQLRALNLQQKYDEGKQLRRASQGILRPKDYQMIKLASIMVINLELYEPEQPMIGSVVEHTWSVDVFNIPIIGIVGDSTGPYAEHSWIYRPLAAAVKDVEEAANVIKFYFL